MLGIDCASRAFSAPRAGRCIVDLSVEKKNVAIVLCRPKYSGNVGSAARCAKNMGISRLIVVPGEEPLEEEAMKTMSTHFAADLIDGIRWAKSAEEALAPFGFVVGTTARTGSARGPVVTPRAMAERVVEISQKNQVALLFGPENTGLSNEEVRLCQMLVTIPSSPRYRSLNLSHAVMILCYELFVVRRQAVGFTPRLASGGEMEGMYDALQELLSKIGFLNPQNPEYWMAHLRRFFGRTGVYAKEVKIFRGICRQLNWYAEHGRKKDRT